MKITKTRRSELMQILSDFQALKCPHFKYLRPKRSKIIDFWRPKNALHFYEVPKPVFGTKKIRSIFCWRSFTLLA
ncbi:MAG: hypothetical protein R6U32_07375, partial [Candidatus Woesearchaeota archaeon]